VRRRKFDVKGQKMSNDVLSKPLQRAGRPLLDDNQLRRFRRWGYLHLPQLIEQDRVAAALGAINHDIMVNGIDPGRIQEYEGTSFCPSVRYDPVITGLLHDTAVWPVLESLLGTGRVARRKRGQIALRFPESDTRHSEAVFPRPHIDGFHNPGNVIAPDQMMTHTVLVAVHLSDVTRENHGNFTLWPGTHEMNSRHYAEHGPQGFPHGYSQTGDSWREQLICRAGDVTLVHYLAGHHPAPNLSPHIRYTTLFRVTTEGLEDRQDAAVRDPWSDWPGMR
jgi:hypothetical protein